MRFTRPLLFVGAVVALTMYQNCGTNSPSSGSTASVSSSSIAPGSTSGTPAPGSSPATSGTPSSSATPQAVATPTPTATPYFQAKNKWRKIVAPGGPSARYDATGAWTGSHFVVWGGQEPSSAYTSTGYMYDPVTNTWKAMSTKGAPSPRGAAVVFGNDSKIVVLGGYIENPVTYLSGGGVYDVASDSWMPLADGGLGLRMAMPTGKYNDHEFMFGGQSYNVCAYNGAVFDYSTGVAKPLPGAGQGGKSAANLVWKNRLYTFNYSGAGYYNLDTMKFTAISAPGNGTLGCGDVPAAALADRIVLGNRYYSPATDTYSPVGGITATAGGIAFGMIVLRASDTKAVYMATQLSAGQHSYLYDATLNTTMDLGETTGGPGKVGSPAQAWSGIGYYSFGGYYNGTYFSDLWVWE